MATTIDGLLSQQQHQENLLLREELQAIKFQLQTSVRTESTLRELLIQAESQRDQALAEAAAAREAATEMEKSCALDERLRADGAHATALSRIRGLEAQLQACEKAFEDRMAARLAELESECEQLRERCAHSDGQAQAARHEAHSAELRAAESAAKAESLHARLDESRSEVARVLDEADGARSAADTAARSEAAALAAAAEREAALEKRCLEAEQKATALPIERDEAIAALRRSYKDIVSALHDRTTALVTREVRQRMVAEERARLRALG